MSTGGHSFHMQDWMKLGGTLGAAAALPFALPAAASALGGGGLSGLLGGTANSSAAGGLASILGPSAGTAALAGDAFMPAALGASGTGTAGLGSQIGGALAGAGPGKFAMGAGKALLSGAFQPQQAPTPQMPPGMGQQQPVQSSAQAMSGVFGDPNQSMANLTPEQRQMLMAQLMQQGH